MIDLIYYKQKLLELKNELEIQKETISNRSMDSLRDSVGELSTIDNHPADLGSETYERQKDLGLKDNVNVLLTKINHALDRIKNKSYGRCEICDKPIDEDRLEAVPYATLCVTCKNREEAHENRRIRPLEEEIIKHPFARSFSAHPDKNEYDGEDTWQEVAKYGTSNSPQDILGAVDYSETYIDSNEEVGIVEKTDTVIDEEDDKTYNGLDKIDYKSYKNKFKHNKKK